MKHNYKTTNRRFLALFLAFILLFSFVACSGKSKNDPSETKLTTATEQPTGVDPTNTEPTPELPVFTAPEEFVDVHEPGVYVEYYNGKSQNTFVSAAVCDTIGGSYATGSSPANGVDTTNYSIVWSGRIKAPTTGWVTFTTLADDGVVLTIDGETIVVDSGPHLTWWKAIRERWLCSRIRITILPLNITMVNSEEAWR